MIVNNKIKKFFKVTCIILFVVLICSSLFFFKEHIYLLTNPYKFKNFILSFGSLGMVVFVFCQILQVVIFFIPGEIMQMAGGYAYGTFLGGILSLLGITIGSIIVFLISRKYGKPFVEKIVSKKCVDKFQKTLNNKKINLIVFILYFLPGMPKDSIVFVCGISNISLKNFIIFSTLGRIPYLFASCYFAANAFTGNKTVLISVLVVMSLIFIIGISKGENLLKKVH